MDSLKTIVNFCYGFPDSGEGGLLLMPTLLLVQ
jgi:hypothetical protein